MQTLWAKDLADFLHRDHSSAGFYLEYQTNLLLELYLYKYKSKLDFIQV